MTYDANGNLTARTDENGKVWTRTYTARNAVRTDADPLGNTTTHTYWSDGLLETVTNPNGRTTRYEYDTCCGGDGGRLKAVVHPDASGFAVPPPPASE